MPFFAQDRPGYGNGSSLSFGRTLRPTMCPPYASSMKRFLARGSATASRLLGLLY